MNIQLINYIVSSILILILALVVYLKNPKSVQNRIFAAFIFLGFVYVASLGIADIVRSPSVSLVAVRTAIVATNYIGFCLYLLAKYFPSSPNKTPKLQIAIIFSISTILSILAYTPYMISSIVITGFGADLDSVGILYYVQEIYLVVMIVASLVILARKISKSDLQQRNQIRFIIYITIFYAFINILIINTLPLFLQYQGIGPLLTAPSTMILFMGFAYVIIRHRLFDIKLVVARSLTYILSIGLIVTIYSLVAFNLSNLIIKNWPVGLKETFYAILAVVLALTYAPIKKFFERITNAIFYRDKYNAQQLINSIGQVMASEIDLDKLSSKVIKELCTEMKIEKGEIVVFGEKQLFYENNIFKKNGNEITQKELRKLGRAMGVYDLLQTGERKELMSQYGISISLPLKTGDRFMGYLLLANKKSGDIYTNEDIKVLEIIGSELSVAVQNALSYKEIQLFSETLAERVRQRTAQLKSANDQLKILDQAKDEFISMASHQLRTPLTTVKGYASMLDEGDFGKLSKEQKEPVQLALDGANRMARLIDDLLNISRMDANRFFLEVASIDLAKVVDQEIAQLQNIAQAKNVKLNYVPPKSSIPEIRLDENKTRQVIMNLVDNAIHYSQPPKGGGEVNVSLELDGQHAVFLVKDNGIGVPEKVKNRLFTKMFRANNAKELRPDGT
ncbi:MAG: Histidine kinase protein, partial [Patescibacteria group bacterium]|nr:Histidine kinase protein [Patescibacteria group bacterium]